MPSIWRWRLNGSETSPDRRAVHALLSEWLDVDHHAHRKPWSWSTVQAGGEHVLDIGLVDDGLVERLLERSEAHRRSGTRRAAPPLSSPLTQVAAVTWQQLAAARDDQPWTLEFVSAVTFRRGNRFLPWPAPSSVFGSLRVTWRTYAGPHVGDLELDLSLDPVIVTRVDGVTRTERVELRNHTTPVKPPVAVTVDGFLGRISYAADGAIDASAVESLVRMAPFCGIGAYTTRGFGAVRAHPAR